MFQDGTKKWIQKVVSILGIVIFCLLLTSVLYIVYFFSHQVVIDDQASQDTMNYIVSDPIYIVGNGDLRSIGLPGSGTEYDPFVISNLNIKGTQNLIAITGTTLWVIIKNN